MSFIHAGVGEDEPWGPFLPYDSVYCFSVGGSFFQASPQKWILRKNFDKEAWTFQGEYLRDRGSMEGSMKTDV